MDSKRQEGLALPEILDFLPEFVFLLDPDFRILWANRNFCQSIGFSPAEITGKYCYQLVHGHPKPPPGCPAVKAFKSAQPCENAMVAECLNQELLVKVSPVKGPDQKIKALWHLSISTKHLIKTAKSLFRTQKYEIVGRLSLGVIHDLKNLLTFLNGQLEILGLTVPEPRVKRRLEKMKRVTTQMSLLAEKLCVLGQPSPQKARYILVNEALNELKALFKILVPKSVRLNLHLDPRACYIYIDPLTFEQIILNLVLNAVEALEKGGEINLYTHFVQTSKGPEVHIVVEDNGPGMSKELLARIFTPFFTTKPSGTGLGLALVKHYVEDAGGQIHVFSEEGKGTRFELVFPGEEEPFKPL